MTYRDALDAALARIAALEAVTGAADVRAELLETKAALASLKKSSAENRTRLRAERDRAWGALERLLEIERALQESQSKSIKRRLARAEQDNTELRDRVAGLESEIAALLDSPERALLHYRQAIARTHARLALASDKAPLERELARLENALASLMAP
ncbi:MAG TPA: hypothetical protein VFB62_01520 [Polyangiaceae bacterium]|jgi:hypothetical protein|nr:hypothetical protein [Polyangiaceae bacterium]